MVAISVMYLRQNMTGPHVFRPACQTQPGQFWLNDTKFMDAFPDLSGVIKPSDIEKKGAHATYVNWARIANYLHKHAPGWQFSLAPNPSDPSSFWWPQPDGTGALMCLFTGPDGQATSLFPFAAMDNRNAPVQLERCSARVFSDTHRRALCAAAAYFFGLGYELWAKDPIENPHRDTGDAEQGGSSESPKPKAVKKKLPPAKKESVDLPPEQQPLEPGDRRELVEVLSAIAQNPNEKNKERFEAAQIKFRETFGLSETDKIVPAIKERQHGDFWQAFIESIEL
jgi:hypothetical protein